MTAPARSFYTQFGRFYAHPSSGVQSALGRQDFGNERYDPKPSITNIISVINEEFLPGYYAKLVATHAVEHLDQLVYSVKRFGPDVAIGQLKAVPNQGNDAAAIGDEVHAAVDKLHRGEVTEEFETVTAQHMFDSYRAFCRNYTDYYKVDTTEYTVWNYQYGYAGTGDLLCTINGETWVIDIKTGNRVYPKVGLQTAAISHGEVIIDDNGTEIPMVTVHRHGVLHVRPRSTTLYELKDSDVSWEAFKAAKTIFDWKRFHAGYVVPQHATFRSAP